MYRLMFYYLTGLVLVAVFLSFLGILTFSPFSLLYTAVLLIAVSWVANSIFSYVFKAPTNLESVYITSLILSLIITPVNSLGNLPFLIWAAVISMASKYIFAIDKKLIFNPAAFAVALTAIAINQSASWWVGTSAMLPFVVIGGVLIIRKIRRTDLFISFLIAALLAICSYSLFKGNNLVEILRNVFLDSPLLFFALIMLTEPQTTPPSKNLRITYGALVGFLFSPQIHIGSFYSTPELALLAGNIFSYLVSSKKRLVLRLKEKIQIAPESYDLIFASQKKFSFKPGQYMEWTLGQEKPDSRGSRRYFTLASSPTERDIRIGVKFNESPSSFKKTLLDMDKDSEIVASQLAGDFVLPKDTNEKCVFIAGGIGITPFRSMIKYLLDSGQKRSIVLFYVCSNASEFVYKDIFDKAKERGLTKTIYVITNRDKVPKGWSGEIGYITPEMIKKDIPDWQERKFYISGPNSMVKAYQKLLTSMNINRRKIITDYFPGY